VAPGDVSIVHHDEDGYGWTMAHGRAHSALDGVVAGSYCGYVEQSRHPFRRREVATGNVAVIISFGGSIDVLEMSDSASAGRRLTSFVAGLHHGYAVTQFCGAQQGVQIDLTPLGAARVLGAPHELANECVGLDELLGRAGDELVERLATAPDWPTRFRLLDRVLLERTAEGPEPDRAVVWAWEQLERSHGQVPVNVLADEIGWSRRHFGDRFRRQVGLAPKPTARVLRFRRAVDLLAAGPVRSIAELAAACGYADHSHLVREFRALGGCTPSQFVGAQLPAAGGVAG
jgi:AraC-like DNA-binding protein